jgi:hypothetical protein
VLGVAADQRQAELLNLLEQAFEATLFGDP